MPRRIFRSFHILLLISAASGCLRFLPATGNNNDGSALNDLSALPDDAVVPAEDTLAVDSSSDFGQDAVLDASSDLPPTLSCLSPTDPDTLALYQFEAAGLGTFVDSSGASLNGTEIGGNTAIVPTASCNGAYHSTSTGGYGLLPMALSGQSIASIEAWISFDNIPETMRPIVSSDADGSPPTGFNHFTLWRHCNGSIVARLQSGTGGGALLCSEPLPLDGTMHHIVVNFGQPGMTMHVDGVPSDFQATLPSGCTVLQEVPCGSTSPEPLNLGQPIAIGTGLHGATPGFSTPALGRAGGRIGAVRFSSIRRTP